MWHIGSQTIIKTNFVEIWNFHEIFTHNLKINLRMCEAESKTLQWVEKLDLKT